MKIGILSMQRIHNFGSFLQAFSLKKNFEELGHDVYFVDIIKGKNIVKDKSNKGASWYLKKIDRYILKRISHYFFAQKMRKMYKDFQHKYLELDKTLKEGELFDIVVIGSDEVFNCTIPSPWGFSSQLLGDVKNAKKVVTYAASCGSTNYEKVCQLGLEAEILASLNKLSYISVRDKNTADFVKLVSGRDSEINLDPVFMYNYDDYIPENLNRNGYILIYAYGNRIKDEQEISAIKAFAKEKGLDIVSVGQYQKWCSNIIIANPFELLEYVKKAEYIITDTFHGTVFSIKYNKKFCTIIRDSNFNKLYDLLQRFNLESQLLRMPTKISSIIENEIDYHAINSIIEAEKNRFNEYINKCFDLS